MATLYWPTRYVDEGLSARDSAEAWLPDLVPVVRAPGSIECIPFEHYRFSEGDLVEFEAAEALGAFTITIYDGGKWHFVGAAPRFDFDVFVYEWDDIGPHEEIVASLYENQGPGEYEVEVRQDWPNAPIYRLARDHSVAGQPLDERPYVLTPVAFTERPAFAPRQAALDLQPALPLGAPFGEGM